MTFYPGDVDCNKVFSLPSRVLSSCKRSKTWTMCILALHLDSLSLLFFVTLIFHYISAAMRPTHEDISGWSL